MLCSAAACRTLCSTWSCSKTGQSRTILPSLFRLAHYLWCLGQCTVFSSPLRVLLQQSRRPTSNWEPCTTNWPCLPTATVDSHCHLPHGDQLPTLPKGACWARESLTCSIAHRHHERSWTNWTERLQCTTAVGRPSV